MGRELRLENLTKRYGDLTAVDHVNLEIQEGEFICFLGPSGCGKTTILRMITGFETVTEGSVIFNDRVINDLIPKKREFGIVFQSYALFPNMTVEENIAFGLKMRKMPKRVIAERVDVMLDLIGLSAWRNLYPAQLSGGQQQRVALVRALAPDPQVLLLDEPLSALDAKIRLRLRAEIKRLQQELKKTMIHVTHDQEEALSIADRVVVMEGGSSVRWAGRSTSTRIRPAVSWRTSSGPPTSSRAAETGSRRYRREEDQGDEERRRGKRGGFPGDPARKMSRCSKGTPASGLRAHEPLCREDRSGGLSGRRRPASDQHGRRGDHLPISTRRNFELRALKQGDEVHALFSSRGFLVFPGGGGRNEPQSNLPESEFPRGSPPTTSSPA